MQIVLLPFVDTTTLLLKLWDTIVITVHVKKLVFLSPRKRFGEAIKREPEELRTQFIEEKGFNVTDMYNGDW